MNFPNSNTTLLYFYFIIEINKVYLGYIFGFYKKYLSKASYIISNNKVVSIIIGRSNSTRESKVNIDFLKGNNRALRYTT